MGRCTFRILFAAGILLVASGCEEAKKSLGLGRTVPDEFAVVSRAPLTMPPDYNLKPPRPGAPRPQEMATRDQAARDILGGRMVAQDASGTEQALLSKAGADKADPNIRETVDRESAILTAASSSFVDDVLFWRKRKEPGTVVNAKEESSRLKANKIEGRSVSEGETPMIVRKSRAPIDSLF